MVELWSENNGRLWCRNPIQVAFQGNDEGEGGRVKNKHVYMLNMP